MSTEEKLRDLQQAFTRRLKEEMPEAVPVYGFGAVGAPVVLIGEAPGARETEMGRPFVGKAGENLNEFLALARMPREALYITNTVKFRPVKVHPRTGSLSNRPPNRAELVLCDGFLREELALLAPQTVVTLGNTPLRALTGDTKLTIGDVHGLLLTVTYGSWTGRVCPLYHPASIIYNRSLAPVYREDVIRLGDALRTLGQLPQE